MKLLLILTSSILLLSSCTQYRYEIFSRSCNGEYNNTVAYTGTTEPYISNYSVGAPELRLPYGYTRFEYYRILNVCDFSYTRTSINK